MDKPEARLTVGERVAILTHQPFQDHAQTADMPHQRATFHGEPTIQINIAPNGELPQKTRIQHHVQAVEPTVHVTIGRLEVRAMPATPPPARKTTQQPAVMDLAEFLRRGSHE